MASYPNKSQFLKNRAIAFAAVFALLIGVGYLVWYHPGDSNAAGGLAVASRGGSGSSWYSTGGTWAYRRQITIDHTKVSGTSNLTSFPVLISVTDPDLIATSTGGLVGKSDGTDILFTSSDGTTKLDHEIESYNSSTGQLVAWVRVPTLSASVDTVIYMYYGNSSASDQQNKTGVWDSNYKGVWHLADNAVSTAVADSTGLNSGTNTANTNTKSSAGQIAKALAYTSTDSTDFGLISPLQGASKATLSIWVKFNSLNDYGGIIGSMDISHADDILELVQGGSGFQDNSTLFMLFDGVDMGYTSSGTLTTGSWMYITAVYDGTQTGNSNRAKVYINGVQQALTFSGTVPATLSNGTDDFTIGSYIDPVGNVDDILDEGRLSVGIARSADWIATEYNNQSSPSTFYAIGGRQSSGRISYTSSSSVSTAPAYKIRGGVKFR
jgi:hypothetical protein